MSSKTERYSERIESESPGAGEKSFPKMMSNGLDWGGVEAVGYL